MRTLLRELRTAARLRLNPPASTYVGEHTVLARSAFGGYIYLDARDASLTPHIALSGIWEPGVARAFDRRVKPGMSVVDVGANCGFYSLIAARRVGPSGRVVAIDANPRMVELMVRTFQANTIREWTSAVHGAVTDVEGEVELGIPGDFLGSASILVHAEGRDEAVRTIRAPGKPLDGWLREPGVDVLKIDAEGAEPLIWRGAQPVLAANRHISIFMEFAPPMLSEHVVPAEFLAEIRAAGFAVQAIDALDGRVSSPTDGEILAARWSELLLTR